MLIRDGEFLHHAPCPRCNSKDNLAVYTDHVFCFGCRYYKKTTDIPEQALVLFKRRISQGLIKQDRWLFLPEDYTTSIPKEGMDWLNQYHITAQDVATHYIGWSQNGKVIRRGTKNEVNFSPCMVFPVYDPYGNLLLWQGRYFGQEKNAPKYFTAGAKDVIHIIGQVGPYVICEDLISAIKISKAGCRSIPLWGSSVNIDLLVRLYGVTGGFTLWLDHDKINEAHKIANRASQFFSEVSVIESELDPKCYSINEIKQYVFR